MAKSSVPRASIEYLRTLLKYDPETGVLTWRLRMTQSVRAGDVAGHIVPRGWRRIIHAKKNYAAAHIAWAFMTGEWPGGQVDHKNRMRGDDRWENLRLATPMENAVNKSKQKGKILPKGVGKHSRKYRARIRVDGRLLCLGSYPTAKEAHEVYLAAAKRYWGEFASDGEL